MSGTCDSRDANGDSLRDGGRRNLRRRRAAARASSAAGQRVAANRRDLLGRSARCDRCARRAAAPCSVGAASSCERPRNSRFASAPGRRSARRHVTFVACPLARRRCTPSARGWPDRARPRRASTGFRRAVLAAVSPRTVPSDDDRRAEARRGWRPRTAGSRRPAEIEDRSGRARRQEQPAGDADRVFARQRCRGQLQVAAVAGQQQHAAELRDPRRTLPPVPRSVAWSWFLDESSALPLST